MNLSCTWSVCLRSPREAIDERLLLTLEVAPQVCHVSLDMRVPPIETGQQHG